MKILSVDTTTSLLSVVAGEGDVFSSVELRGGLRHAENLPSIVESCCNNIGMKPADFELLSVCLGPGSFTGLRIGLAFIKGLSSATGIPFVGVNSLDVYASSFYDLTAPVLSVVDARKKRFYAALYYGKKRISDYLDADRDAVLSCVKDYERVFVTGPDASIFKGRWFYDDERFVVVPSFARGAGPAVLSLSESVFESMGAFAVNTEPFYLRLSEAEIGITRSSDNS